MTFEIDAYGNIRDGGTGHYYGTSLEIDIQISDAFKLSIEPDISYAYDEIEYVDNAELTDDYRYIRSTINRIETSLEIRFTYNITPAFTIQYYGMPFISSSEYKDYKYITESKANKFDDRFSTYTDNQINYNSDDEVFEIDENLNGETDYSFDDPNFNIKDFNSNLVLRWEYLTGSAVYLVWTQQRYEDTREGNHSLENDAYKLFKDT